VTDVQVSASPVPRGVVLRDFIWTLIRTDFKARYHGAVGGFVWALAKPIVMFVVLHRVFQFLFKDSTYLYNLLIGILLWSFFSEGTVNGLESLYRKGFLLTKASFPRWVVVATSIVNALITLIVYSVAIVVVLGFGRGLPSPLCLALFLLYLVLFFLIVLGFSLGASVLFLKYRDLNQVWDVALQAGFFVAPIMYPLSILPEKFHIWLYFWPVTPIIQFSRQVLVDGTPPTLKAHLLLFAIAFGTFAIGVGLFRRYAPRAMETL
jgi:lipopolysaccharide transport system permease protein